MNLLYRLWLRFGRLKPLVVEPSIVVAPTPVPPAGEAREPVNDQDGVHMRATVARRREVMDLLCMHANAYVYRDYGTGECVVEHDRPLPPTDESTLLEIACVAAEQHPYETAHLVAHLVARLTGEEGPGHPRQKAARWLEKHGWEGQIAQFNVAYSARMRGYNIPSTATFGALADTLGLAEARRVYLSYVTCDAPDPT